MPLNTEILRDGEPRDIRWGYFHLSCMYTAAIKEAVPDMKGLIANNSDQTFGGLENGEFVDFSMSPIYYLNIPGCNLVEEGRQKLKQRHEFVNPTDGEVFILEPGDILHAWRTHKHDEK